MKYNNCAFGGDIRELGATDKSVDSFDGYDHSGFDEPSLIELNQSDPTFGPPTPTFSPINKSFLESLDVSTTEPPSQEKSVFRSKLAQFHPDLEKLLALDEEEQQEEMQTNFEFLAKEWEIFGYENLSEVEQANRVALFSSMLQKSKSLFDSLRQMGQESSVQMLLVAISILNTCMN